MCKISSIRLSTTLVFNIERIRDSELVGDCFESDGHAEISSASFNLTRGGRKIHSSSDLFTH